MNGSTARAETLRRVRAMPVALTESRTPHLIGVRHHSVACALAMPALLEAAAPTRIFLEMPAELQEWIPWVGHAETLGPVALASVASDELLSFYPLATFSPERVAIQWAVARGVPLIAFDTSAGPAEEDGESTPGSTSAEARVLGAGFAALWDRAVESRAGGDPEDVRRAGLRAGWALRTSGPARRRDLARETFMRRALADAREGSVAIVGAFHPAALLDEPLHWEAVEPAALAATTTSLVPYDHTLLDERSGYPAGIRDPGWHESLFEHVRAGHPLDDVLLEQATRLVRHVRRHGHPGDSSAASEMVRLARGLARLRAQPHPTRAELDEAARTVLGRGGERAFERILEQAFVGRSRGRLAPGTPRSGMLAHLEDLAGELGFPRRGEEAKDLRLDVLRSERDRRRHVALSRMSIAGVRYAELRTGQAAGGIETLQTVWRCEWTPATDASVPHAGRFGVTLAQAAQGALRERARAAIVGDALDASARLELLGNALRAGLPDLAHGWLSEWSERWPADARLPQLIAFASLLRRLEAGHEPAVIPEEASDLVEAAGAEIAAALTQAHAVLAGLAGSEDLADARALLELVQLGGGGDRLRMRLDALRTGASPMMQGAAWGASLLAGYAAAAPAGAWIASWIANAESGDARLALSKGLAGLFVASGSLLEVAPAVLEEMVARIDALDDAGFLRRLPALRKGFGVLSKVERARLIQTLAERGVVDRRALERLPIDPESLVRYATLDQAAASRTEERLGPRFPRLRGDGRAIDPTSATEDGADDTNYVRVDTGGSHLSTGTRWRLILGQQREQLTRRGRRIASALAGEAPDPSSGGAGDEQSEPSIREWIGELETLFGVDVCQEVLADAAEERPHLLTELDPQTARPSVELLSRILNLAGSLGEGDLAKVRPLIARIVRQLSEDLANRVAPALFGARSARPTRRPSSRLDLARTVRRNLHTARDDGHGLYLVPEQAIFRAAEKKRLTWEVVILLDVSGSMEPSVVHTALMAGILAGVPWVELELYAFSTEVVDLSEHVDDPLALLLSVNVGGGTDIGGAVRYAEERIQNPRRAMLIVVSDFEEMGTGLPPLDAVGRLHEAGVKTLGIAALDEVGRARFNTALAAQLRARGMPVAAVSPPALARWMREQVQS